MTPVSLACLTLASASFFAIGPSLRVEDLKAVAAYLGGYRFEFPCKDPMPENPKPGADGISARATDDPATNDKFADVKKFGTATSVRGTRIAPRRKRQRASLQRELLQPSQRLISRK